MANLITLPKPASEWTSNDLKAFNIIVQEQTTEEFFGGPLPEYTGPPGFLQFEDCREDELRFSDVVSRLLFVRLDDAMGLVDGKPKEKVLADFTVEMLRTMGYESDMTWVCRQKETPLLMCGEMVLTSPDVCVVHDTDGVILVVQEDKSRFELMDVVTRTPEAQLIADAIAAFQANNRKRLEPLPQALIAGILMDRTFPKFYKIEVTKELNQAVRLGLHPATTTTVYRHTPQVPGEIIDGMVTLDNRKTLMRCIQALKRIVFQLQGDESVTGGFESSLKFFE